MTKLRKTKGDPKLDQVVADPRFERLVKELVPL
jgi:hypothetical protein